MAYLYNKFNVTKVGGEPIDPKAEYFVLRVDKDYAAQQAVLKYADFIYLTDPEFAQELRDWVAEFRQSEMVDIGTDGVEIKVDRDFLEAVL